MFSARLLLLFMICGCWALPLPSTRTLIWSVLDNGQNQVDLLCLVNSRQDAIITVWISNINGTGDIISEDIQMNIMPASSTQNYFFTFRSDQSPVEVQSHLVQSSHFSTGSVIFHLSISQSLPIIPRSPSLNMPLYSVRPSKQMTNLIPSPSLPSRFILQPAFMKNTNADPQQDLNIHISQLVTGQFHNFAHLSLPIDSYRLWDSAASCFIAEAENVELNDTLGGELGHPLCFDEDFSMMLALRMTQDSLLVLAIRIMVFKLFILDLLLTWIGMFQKYRLENSGL